MFWLRAFTRLPEGDEYSPSLAGSVHFEYSWDGARFAPLNQNYGVLFPRAELRPDDTIDPRCALAPRLWEKDGSYGISARFCALDGADRAPGRLYFWTTNDFLSFEDAGLIPKEALNSWKEAENAALTLPEEMGREIVDAWAPLFAQAAFLPAGLKIRNAAELADVKAVLRYSDGSEDEKAVDWDVPAEIVGPDGRFVPGRHEVRGRIRCEALPYPLAVGYADPMLFRWEGSWYFLSTNDNLGDIGLFVRRAASVPELFGGGAAERCILPYCPEKGWVQTFWAPEFHVIGGRAYILFALGGKQWAPQCHMMRLKPNGDILDPESWEAPVRVERMDGSPLAADGISLDMTHFSVNGRDHLAWSYRRHIGTPLDTGSMIYIAAADPQKPWRLTSEPVLLTRPLLGWEHTVGTINNEGPHPLLHGGKVYLAYSGGSANGYSYAVGYLIADQNADLLDPKNWKKHPCPALSSYSVGIDGPGHNSFYVSDAGKTMVAYHGQKHTRCSAIHRVHFNKRGFPLLNMAPERDLPASLRPISLIFETD